jgi:hypothetical protein
MHERDKNGDSDNSDLGSIRCYEKCYNFSLSRKQENNMIAETHYKLNVFVSKKHVEYRKYSSYEVIIIKGIKDITYSSRRRTQKHFDV